MRSPDSNCRVSHSLSGSSITIKPYAHPQCSLSWGPRILRCLKSVASWKKTCLWGCDYFSMTSTAEAHSHYMKEIQTWEATSQSYYLSEMLHILCFCVLFESFHSYEHKCYCFEAAFKQCFWNLVEKNSCSLLSFMRKTMPISYLCIQYKSAACRCVAYLSTETGNRVYPVLYPVCWYIQVIETKIWNNTLKYMRSRKTLHYSSVPGVVEMVFS